MISLHYAAAARNIAIQLELTERNQHALGASLV